MEDNQNGVRTEQGNVVIISETEGKALAEGEGEKRRMVGKKHKEENCPIFLELRPAHA